jgi:hypothetical protein
MALVVPRGAGAWQGLRGGEPEGQQSWWGVDPAQSWGPWPEWQGSQHGVYPVQGWSPVQRGGEPGEQSSHSAGLQGGDLAGRLFFN